MNQKSVAEETEIIEYAVAYEIKDISMSVM